jgi:hypothetical protein
MTSKLRWVHDNMPDESSAAFRNFVTVNPRWNGADWMDCLDALLDSDSHLELTEPLYEQAEDEGWQPYLELVCPIAITLLWSRRFANEEWSDVVTLDEVAAVLERARAPHA